MNNESKQIALIDLGSSTIKLGVYSKETKEQVKKEAITVNMAENFYPDMVLTDGSISRVTEALKSIKEVLDKDAITPILVTTGVARKAKNIEILKERIKEIVGWDLEIISGDAEAEIFYKGVVSDFPVHLKIAAINIGGGSTEITFGSKDNVEGRVSIPLGVSNLNELYITDDPPTSEKVETMVKDVKEQLDSVLKEEYKPDILIYTGGELTYMTITKHKLEDSSYSPSHPKMISLENFKNRYNEVVSMKKEELYKLMPENPHWMDGAVSCTAIAITIAEKLEMSEIIPSDKNLNDGLLLRYL